MRNIKDFINEGLFPKKKRTNPEDLPNKMPKRYVDFFEKYFWKDIDRNDIKDETDVEEYLLYTCDEFWDMLNDEFHCAPIDGVDGDFEYYREIVYNKWKDQIIKIALR